MSPDQVSADAESPPTEGERTLGPIIPDFFQEEDEPALRSQVQWVEEHLGLSDRFFARFLRILESSFRDWRLQQAALPLDRQEMLRGFWHTVLYLDYFTKSDVQALRGFLERQRPAENEWGRRHPHAPPWSGSTLRTYLEEGGPALLPDVDEWLEYFWRGNPFVF